MKLNNFREFYSNPLDYFSSFFTNFIIPRSVLNFLLYFIKIKLIILKEYFSSDDGEYQF
jgi:hypothetical protein